MKPWHEQDTFWENFEPALFSQRRCSEAAVEVENIISLLHLQPGMRVLDLGCGVGRHSLEFARRGFHVTGVDRTRSYLDKASEQAATEGLTVEFIQADMRTFSQQDFFDAAVNMYTSFGYFENPEEDRRVGTNVYRSVKPGGVALIEMVGKEVLCRIFQERSWREEDDILILEERKVRNGWDWIDVRWILIKNGVQKEQWMSLRLYSATELCSLLKACGFVRTENYGDLAGHPYNHLAKRLVVAAHK